MPSTTSTTPTPAAPAATTAAASTASTTAADANPAIGTGDAPAPADNVDVGDTVMGGTSAGATAAAAEGTGATTNGAADALPANPTANGDTIRHYLNTRVSGPIIAGLKKIAREQPQDPIRALGEFLIQVADSLEIQQRS